MARGSTKVTIDGEVYELTQLGALKGREIYLSLLQSAAAAVKELADADALSPEAFVAGIAGIVESLDTPKLTALCDAFGRASRVQVDEKWPEVSAIFDDHFAGRYLHMTKWLAESIVFNFADFFGVASLGKLGEVVKQAMAKMAASPSKSPRTSTGSSGES